MTPTDITNNRVDEDTCSIDSKQPPANTTNSWADDIIDSKQPRLRAFGKNTLWVTTLILALNIVTLIAAFFFFYTRCRDVTEVFPNSLTTSETDQLIGLQNQAGVTIKTQYWIVYSSSDTYPLLDDGSTYWEPKAITCGCGEGGGCQLASCSGTNPVYVVYESCIPSFEAFSLASGLVIYANAAVSILVVIMMWVMRVNQISASSMGGLVLSEMVQPL
jgi:hypothetical protein